MTAGQTNSRAWGEAIYGVNKVFRKGFHCQEFFIHRHFFGNSLSLNKLFQNRHTTGILANTSFSVK